MLVAIHQPNFFPWLGYFNKLMRTDAFIFLDAVPYPKSGNSMGSWSNRVSVCINGKPSWIRCPVVRESGEQLINSVKIKESDEWRRKLIETMDINYKRAKCFGEVSEWLFRMVSCDSELLAQYNDSFISSACDVLGIETKKIRQSELNLDRHLASTELLVALCRAAGADAYLCGAGAAGYQDDDLFEAAGVKVVHQNFLQEEYTQLSTKSFLPGLSIIDALLNCGIEKTRKLITGKQRLRLES